MKLRSFSIENFKSFFSEQRIEFDVDHNNVDIFVGPNNSGKSNIFQALGLYKSFIQKSTAFESGKERFAIFAFNTESEDLPITFNAEMEINKYVYSYKFSYRNEKIISEVLKRSLVKEKLQYKTLFSRLSMDKNAYEEFGFDNKMLKSTREDSLVLTKAFENNNKYALEVFNWLSHLKFMSEETSNKHTAERISDDDEFKQKVLDLLRRADLNIQDLSSKKGNMPEEFFDQLPIYKAVRQKLDRTTYDVNTTHLIHDSKGRVVNTKAMSLSTESKGTNRIFELAFPILDTLEKGNIFYIDEFETNLHHSECKFLIELFTSSENINKAQLIINTHNTLLLDLVGRDSVHLVGKNNREETIVGQISKNIRSDDKLLSKKYTKGMFGAIPNIKS